MGASGQAPKTGRNYYLAVALTLLVQGVTPLSWWTVLQYAAKAYAAGALLPLPRHSIGRIWFILSLFEVPFSLYLSYLTYLAKQIKQPVPVDEKLLETLLQRCLSVGLQPAGSKALSEGKLLSHSSDHVGVHEDSATLFRKRTELWFHPSKFEDLRADNIREWMTWALLSKDWKKDGLNTEKERTFIDRAVALTAKRCGRTFPDGYNPSVTCMRLTLDPLNVRHRPLGHYVVINTATRLTIEWLKYFHGFEHVKEGHCEFFVKRPTPDAPKVTGEATSLPIVFLHGLGIGLGQYGLFLGRLARHKPGVLIYLQPWISGQIWHRDFLSPQTPEVQGRAIASAMRSVGFTRSTVLSHSNGTMVHGWLLREARDLCERNVLVDAVSFRLWEGWTCFTFTRKPWNTSIEVLLGYFVATELSVAHTIGRLFAWTTMILWTDEIPDLSPERFHVVLGQRDFLIDVPGAVDYLTESGVQEECISVVAGYQHGQALFKTGTGMDLACKHAGIR